MARPARCRKICAEPAYDAFVPTGIPTQESVCMTVVEYEVIRLLDLENLTQAQCAQQMGVARTTVTDIYTTARRKLADCLVHGKQLRIAGGHYTLCHDTQPCRQTADCPRGALCAHTIPSIQKGANHMRIAVTYENEQVFPHFGHTRQFKLYDVAESRVQHTEVLDTLGQGHGALGAFLKQAAVDVVICGGIGSGAQSALANAGITVYGGVQGRCDEAVQALLQGSLLFSTDATCHHHAHEHTCGADGCGAHDCHTHGCDAHDCHHAD